MAERPVVTEKLGTCQAAGVPLRRFRNGFGCGMAVAVAPVPAGSFGILFAAHTDLGLQGCVAGVLAIRLVDVHRVGGR